jgi:methyl-accepting chemotaxis protein
MASTNKTRESVTERAKELAGEAKDRAQEAAHGVAERASEVASNVGRRADSAVESAGSGMQSFAETVRERGPSSGVLGSATSAVADTLEGAGEYLEEHGLSGVAKDLTDLVRKNPIPALLVGIGLGFLIARATRS